MENRCAQFGSPHSHMISKVSVIDAKTSFTERRRSFTSRYSASLRPTLRSRSFTLLPARVEFLHDLSGVANLFDDEIPAAVFNHLRGSLGRALVAGNVQEVPWIPADLL